MEINRAIETLEKTLKANYKFLDPDFRRALGQAIEALQEKREREIPISP